MKTIIPEQIQEAYGPRGETQLEVLVARPSLEVSQETRAISVPARYNSITIADIQEGVEELGYNLEITYKNGNSFETSFAKGIPPAVSASAMRALRAPQEGKAHVSTFQSSLIANSGQGVEQTTERHALGNDLQMYDGSPGNGGSSFINNEADIWYMQHTGRTVRDAESGPEAIGILRDCAAILHERAEANISYLTADDPYGIAFAVGVAVELKKLGHDIKGLVLYKPPDFYLPEHYAIPQDKLAVRALKSTTKAYRLIRGDRDLAEQTPDKNFFNRPEVGKKAKEWLEAGYRKAHPEADGLPSGVNSLATFIKKYRLEKAYKAHQARYRGEGLIRDLQALIAISPNTNISFIINPPEDEAVAHAIKDSVSGVMKQVAQGQMPGAVTQAYMTPAMHWKYRYPNTYFNGFWLGIRQDAMQVSEKTYE